MASRKKLEEEEEDQGGVPNGPTQRAGYRLIEDKQTQVVLRLLDRCVGFLQTALFKHRSAPGLVVESRCGIRVNILLRTPLQG